jgi:hypothetical protein
MPCCEAGRRKKEKPRSAKLAGVDGGHKTHAIWLRKRRDESSRSAMEASDCFRVLPGLVTRLASENSDNCRLKRRHRAGKPKFSIAQTGVIGIFFEHYRAMPRYCRSKRYLKQALKRNTEHREFDCFLTKKAFFKHNYTYQIYSLLLTGYLTGN